MCVCVFNARLRIYLVLRISYYSTVLYNLYDWCSVLFLISSALLMGILKNSQKVNSENLAQIQLK